MKLSVSLTLGSTCILVMAITLTLGLWPFHAPRNQVKWLSDSNGLSFGRRATAFSLDTLDMSRATTGRSIEIWVQPEPFHSSTLLSFFNPAEASNLLLRQSLTDFELRAVIQDHQHIKARARLYVDDVLRHKTPIFIAVTTGGRGTQVFINGILARSAPEFRILDAAFRGRLILGDAPRSPDNFHGDVRGLAIYQTELTAVQVCRHYHAWTAYGQPKTVDNEHSIALYLFNERAGAVVYNRVRPGIDLTIPERYSVLGKWSLQPVWSEFENSLSYWKAVLKNIVGFIPLGCCFYPFLLLHNVKKPTFTTLIVGVLVSLIIEVLQAFLPTRDSGTTDILTNTLGTGLGVLFYRTVGLPVFQRLPRQLRARSSA